MSEEVYTTHQVARHHWVNPLIIFFFYIVVGGLGKGQRGHLGSSCLAFHLIIVHRRGGGDGHRPLFVAACNRRRETGIVLEVIRFCAPILF